MAQYRVRDQQQNATRQQLETRSGPPDPWVKAVVLYIYQLTRPLQLGGDDPDPPIVQFLKVAADKTSAGFADQSEVDAFVGNAADLDASAVAHGTTMENLTNGYF